MEASKWFSGKEGNNNPTDDDRFLVWRGVIRSDQRQLIPSAVVLERSTDVPANPRRILDKLLPHGAVIATRPLISGRAAEPSDTLQHLMAASQLCIQERGSPLFDLIVFDEGHHGPADTWQLVKTHLGGVRWTENGLERRPFIVYMTGTPYRLISGTDYEDVTMRFRLSQAIRAGTAKDIVMLNITTAANEEERVRQIGRVVAHLLNNKRALSHNTTPHKALAVVNGTHRASTYARIINDARIVLHRLDGGGVRYLRAEAIAGREPDHVKERKLEQFQMQQVFDNDSIDFLLQHSVLGEGYDFPFISVVAFMSPVKTLSRFAQTAGRGTRGLSRDNVGRHNSVVHDDNVCHLVSHIDHDQVQMFRKFQLEDPEDEVQQGGGSDEDNGEGTHLPVPPSPAVGDVLHIDRYFYINERDRADDLEARENRIHFTSQQNWQVNTVRNL